MPLYIGDYLADTMHLSTEQHGAYLLLLFHLWRRGVLQDDDAVLAQITGLPISAWTVSRAVLAEFFEIHDGQWHHGRVEREKSRTAAKQKLNANRAKLGASTRWGKSLRKQCFKHSQWHAWRCQITVTTTVIKNIAFVEQRERETCCR
jgi:uncharacterized protein YdaU (DUF1376 family)